MLKKRMNKKGFTMVELIIVIAIMAVLSAIIVPTVMTTLNKSKDSSINEYTAGIATIIVAAGTPTPTAAAIGGELTATVLGDYVVFLYNEDGTGAVANIVAVVDGGVVTAGLAAGDDVAFAVITTGFDGENPLLQMKTDSVGAEDDNAASMAITSKTLTWGTCTSVGVFTA
jgi:type IV pilus assembly protein PilA